VSWGVGRFPLKMGGAEKRRSADFLKRKRTPLGPFHRPMPKVPGGVLGGWAFSYERGTPVLIRVHWRENVMVVGGVRLTQGTVTSTMRRAPHLSGCAK
jgi:hypothetical protein